ncbi:ecotropic viral integration site 5 ortholog [Austrofundulus limnaeus]|uniref:Ecotropic viral integration site 5 ortholog n=1 Tax=Austrofundulus limnaeus TaxID=52670 RepID=A0A2I4ASZ5_AUSLI|nr:PREDICTED: carabin [Austrofundulus limnaeus]
MSSEAQRTQSEEDSSGSDLGSEVKLRCQKGIPDSLRAKCWPLLCGANDRMRQNKNLYESLDSQPGLQSWVDIIERDLDRQFPFHEMFLSKDGHGQRGLFRVLKAYTQFQPEEGYCQAQGPVAAVLLMNMPAEEAFWCLVQISEQYLPGYYSPSLEGVLFDATILAWVLKKTCPAAHKHLQQHGVEPLMFATDWLMCLFTRHLPFNTLIRVWDLFFCYGVRVLLQVAVVLVRRVLGRAEQRKECVGQMETLEKLRGVKAQVQDEEDAFIDEVCSVPLSSKDLEKRIEKELEKWRKDKPSSTFDPRGRCHGFRMAWARARQREEERERNQREKGNLSVPLERSASTLSLSPSLLHKRWKKGGKVNAGDLERGNKIVRHLSMGAKDDWRNWTDLELKKVQGVQEEEDVQEGHKTKTEFKEKESEERLEEPKVESIIITEHKEETITVKLTNKQDEIKSTEEESQPGSRTTLEQKEERPDNDQTAETISHPTEVSSPIIQETLTDENHQTSEETETGENHQTSEETETGENHQTSEETETGENHQTSEETETETGENHQTSEETETEMGENHHTALEDIQTEKQAENRTNAEAELQGSKDSGEETIKQADVIPEEETENTPEDQADTAAQAPDTGSETDLDQDQDPKTGPRQEQEEVITETKVETFDEKHLSDESSVETTEESHEQETETQGPVKNAAAQDRVDAGTTRADTATETETPTLPENVQRRQETETKGAESDVEGLITNTPGETPEPDLRETGTCAPTEETQTAAQTSEGAADRVAPAGTKEILMQSPELSEESSTPVNTSETRAPERPESPFTAGGEEGEDTEKVQENTAGKVFEPTLTGSNKLTQDRDSQAAKDRSQAPGRRSSCSSGDVCIRKSSSSKLTRRLSEDLFTSPEKTTVIKEVKTIQAAPDETPTETLQPDTSKRFGLLRKLRGETPRKDKQKKPKLQVPKILIQDFSYVTEPERPTEDRQEGKLSSRERRRRRREQERKEKEGERLKKKKERRKPQTRGKGFQQEGKSCEDAAPPAKTGSQTLRFSASYAESYF